MLIRGGWSARPSKALWLSAVSRSSVGLRPVPPPSAAPSTRTPAARGLGDALGTLVLGPRGPEPSSPPSPPLGGAGAGSPAGLKVGSALAFLGLGAAGHFRASHGAGPGQNPPNPWGREPEQTGTPPLLPTFPSPFLTRRGAQEQTRVERAGRPPHAPSFGAARWGHGPAEAAGRSGARASQRGARARALAVGVRAGQGEAAAGQAGGAGAAWRHLVAGASARLFPAGHLSRSVSGSDSWATARESWGCDVPCEPPGPTELEEASRGEVTAGWQAHPPTSVGQGAVAPAQGGGVGGTGAWASRDEGFCAAAEPASTLFVGLRARAARPSSPPNRQS